MQTPWNGGIKAEALKPNKAEVLKLRRKQLTRGGEGVIHVRQDLAPRLPAEPAAHTRA